MKIGIDASRAFAAERTGIEEYAFQMIKYLRNHLGNHEVILYIRRGDNCSFSLPPDWKVKEVPFNYLWTQLGLAWDMLAEPIDVLFVPAHTIPWIHPQKTVVTVHGLEYEHCPENYSLFSRLFHRFFVRKSCYWASQIVAVSENTKKDLVKMYKVPAEKIEVVYNGYEKEVGDINKTDQAITVNVANKPYLLYIGRLEKRKNVVGIVKAFDVLKEKYNFEGRLILAGKPGHGYEEIKAVISASKSKYDIVEAGFITEEKKWQLLKKAEVFMFPSLCEGFGIPILEAQSFGVPVITSNFGPMDEVTGSPDILIDPYKPDQMAELANRLIGDKDFRTKIVIAGHENVKRFSWDKSAREVAELLN